MQQVARASKAACAPNCSCNSPAKMKTSANKQKNIYLSPIQGKTCQAASLAGPSAELGRQLRCEDAEAANTDTKTAATASRVPAVGTQPRPEVKLRKHNQAIANRDWCTDCTGGSGRICKAGSRCRAETTPHSQPTRILCFEVSLAGVLTFLLWGCRFGWRWWLGLKAALTVAGLARAAGRQRLKSTFSGPAYTSTRLPPIMRTPPHTRAPQVCRQRQSNSKRGTRRVYPNHRNQGAAGVPGGVVFS